jgi:hypothetical protein
MWGSTDIPEPTKLSKHHAHAHMGIKAPYIVRGFMSPSRLPVARPRNLRRRSGV